MGTPIPTPPGLPLVGNINDIDPTNLVGSANHLTDIYGPIYKLSILGKTRITVSSQELVNELCDEKKYHKAVSGALLQVRNGIGDGLFTAFHDEHNWGVAHRVLMPSFGPFPIKDMFDEMHDIASQLVSKWARYGPSYKIPVTEDFTRLTLDSIALCAMDTRFNSFYREDLHPFVNAMVGFLTESGKRSIRSQWMNDYIYRDSTRQYQQNIDLMKSVANEVIKNRRANPVDKKDLVNAFVLGKDPKTGEHMSDENITNNMITLLIAGHETTSGLLSFLFVLLLKNPDAYQTAQKEIDEVIGRGPVTYEHMSKIPYITACLRETLRLHPTAPGFSVLPNESDPTKYPIYVGKERYEVQYDQALGIFLPRLHRDPEVYGEDAEAFRPERMLDENFIKLPPNSWKPFGNGARACIGRPFAWQEALLAVCLLLQNFNFRADDPGYQLSYSQTLTIKPKGFYMYATLRDGIDPIHLEHNLYGKVDASEKMSAKDKKIEGMGNGTPEKPMTILYGSNTGTCESLAQTLATQAPNHGFKATVKTLDTVVNNVPKDEPVVIVTASYEGQPTDNAAQFVSWLEKLNGNELSGVKYSVFGCGHHDWQATFHRIPSLCDKLLKERGAQRIAAPGYADVANGDIFNDFDKWTDGPFWKGVSKEFGGEEDKNVENHSLDIEIRTNVRAANLRQDVSEAIVKDVKVLTAPGESEKRHIEIQLPTDMTYRAGDYLAVLPLNHSVIVKRVMNRFGLPWDAHITIKEGQQTMLPTGQLMPVFAVLSAYVELAQPATLKNVAAIARSIPEESARMSLLALTESPESFLTHITSKRTSALDLLEDNPTAALPLSSFLTMLPPMRIRQYSISSSPLADPTVCTLTYSRLDAEPLSSANEDSSHTNGTNEASSKPKRRYLGIASNYLSSLTPGDKIRVSVRPSHQSFHPPLDIASVPLVMICSGTGIAPFRAFVQERAKQIQAGRTVAKALLFVGCRHSHRDCLYKADFATWAHIGAVDIRYAFSNEMDKSAGCKYVQDRLQHDIADAMDLWKAGAKVFFCGASRPGEAVREVIMAAYADEAKRAGKEKTKAEIEEWFAEIRNERFASDVFE